VAACRGSGERTASTAGSYETGPLLRAARAGDERAWGLLVARYHAIIKGVARRHRLSAADQDEVVQRTWLRLLERGESVREPAAIGAWLVTVARHECLRLLAAAKRHVLVEDPRCPDAADPATVEDEAIAATRAEALHAALGRLPAHQERVLRALVAAPELDYQQLGARLGMPRGSIGPTRARGLARLRNDPRLASAIHGHIDRRTPGGFGAS
jgi:RNA polymerase sigma factor (sigma-70 family)